MSNIVLENVTTETRLEREGTLAAGKSGSINGVHFHKLVMGGKVIDTLSKSHIAVSGEVKNVTFSAR